MRKEKMIAVLENVKKDGVTIANFAELEAMIADLKAEIRKENNRRAGAAANIEKAAYNVIKSAKKKDARQILHGAWISKNGRQYVCDGFRAIEINNPIELEKIPEKTEPLDIEKMFVMPDHLERFELPTAAELKSMIAETKADAKIKGIKSPKIVYACEDGPLINADFLMDAITATGARYLESYKGRTGKYTGPCFLESSDCTAIICPVNHQPQPIAKCYIV